MLESLFNKVAGLMVCNFIKKETPLQFFPENIAKILRTSFCMEHLGWLLLWCLLESFFAAGYLSLMVMMVVVMMIIIVIFSDKSWLLVSIHFI